MNEQSRRRSQLCHSVRSILFTINSSFANRKKKMETVCAYHLVLKLWHIQTRKPTILKSSIFTIFPTFECCQVVCVHIIRHKSLRITSPWAGKLLCFTWNLAWFRGVATLTTFASTGPCTYSESITIKQKWREGCGWNFIYYWRGQKKSVDRKQMRKTKPFSLSSYVRQ